MDAKRKLALIHDLVEQLNQGFGEQVLAWRNVQAQLRGFDFQKLRVFFHFVLTGEGNLEYGRFN